MSKLPALSTMSPSPSFRPYSSYQYSKHKGLKVKGEKTNIISHPPVRQRPLSANPTSGSLQKLKNPTIAGNWTNGFSNSDNPGAKALDSVIDLDIRLHETEDKLNNLVNTENECFKKDCIIESLREQVEYMRRRSCSDSSPSPNYSAGCHHKIAALQSQIQLTSEDNDRLLVENEDMHREIDDLRRGNNTEIICAENQNLHAENERLKEAFHESNCEVSQLKVLLAQGDDKLTVLEKEVNRVTKEKSQTTVMINTLQNEVASQEEQLIEARADVERHKTDLENKKNELATVVSRLAKNLDCKQTLKGREKEISNLKCELKSLQEKICTKDNQIVKLHYEVKEANKNISESDSIYKCQLKSYQDKLCAKDTNIKNLNIQLSASKLALEESKERERENRSNEIEAMKSVSGIFCKIEKRLGKNGRSCKSLSTEIEALRGFQAPDKLRWVKECFLSSLGLELSWEKEIEDTLKSVTGDSERADTPPTLLIQILHEKLDMNLKEIDSLEKQMNSTNLRHTKDIENLSNMTKEKYKQKAEKAIREIKGEERKKLDQEIQRVREEESERLTQALNDQQAIIENDVEDLQEVKEEVVALQNERNTMQVDFELLRKDIEQCRANEIEYKERLEHNEKERKMYETMMEDKLSDELTSKKEMVGKIKSMEQQCCSLKENNDLKRREIEEMRKTYKDKISEQSETITSLEYQVISLKHCKATTERRVETLDELAKDYKEKEHIFKEEKERINKLNKEIAELHALNETLKSTLEEAHNDCMKEKETSILIKEELHSALANLSDLKGDLSDKEKQKMEHLEEKSLKQGKEMAEQQIHLVKLSTLVDEQKIKLIEQDREINAQREMLDSPWAREKCKYRNKNITEVQQIGERCIEVRHDEIIEEQRNMITDMKQSLASAPVVATLDHHKQYSAEIAKAIHYLKDELAAQEREYAVSDQKLYTEVCRLEEQLIAMNAELSSEQLAHQNNMEALQQGEEVYFTFVHEINKELDIGEILGAEPLSFLLKEERERILIDRGKGLEVILNRIKSVKSRIELKDQLLQSYDNDLKQYHETESYAEQKSHEVHNLQTELTEARSKVSHLQEAIKKRHGECENLKKEIMSLNKSHETEKYADKKSHEVQNLQAELAESRNQVSDLKEALEKWHKECDTLKKKNTSLKQSRDTDNHAEKKSQEVHNLQAELTESRNKVSELQEALEKWRAECEHLKEEITSLKQKYKKKKDDKSDSSSSSSKESKSSKKKKSKRKGLLFDYFAKGEDTA